VFSGRGELEDVLLQALDQDLEREDAWLEGLDHDTRVWWGEMLKRRREAMGGGSASAEPGHG
jgi:hypothetical protein